MDFHTLSKDNNILNYEAMLAEQSAEIAMFMESTLSKKYYPKRSESIFM